MFVLSYINLLEFRGVFGPYRYGANVWKIKWTRKLKWNRHLLKCLCCMYYCFVLYWIMKFSALGEITLWLPFNLWVRFQPGANFHKDDRNDDKSLNAADQTLPLQCNPDWQVNKFKRLKRNSKLIPQKSLHYWSMSQS